VVDALITELFLARLNVKDEPWAPQAHARIEGARRAIIGYGRAAESATLRREMMVDLLDSTTRLLSVEQGKMYVQVMLQEALPLAKVPREVIGEAVELWPQAKRRTARTKAIRALARCLHCDSPSLLTMLRQARKRLRDRRRPRRN
jgi:hypothetical protein